MSYRKNLGGWWVIFNPPPPQAPRGLKRSTARLTKTTSIFIYDVIRPWKYLLLVTKFYQKELLCESTHLQCFVFLTLLGADIALRAKYSSLHSPGGIILRPSPVRVSTRTPLKFDMQCIPWVLQCPFFIIISFLTKPLFVNEPGTVKCIFSF